MKTTVQFYAILFLSVGLTYSMKLVNRNEGSIFEEDESTIAYRTSAIDNRKKAFTAIKPDETSSPLKLSKEQIGRFSWAVLHSMAAAYPKNPNDAEKQNAVTFLHSFAKMFPCKVCSGHFQKMLADFPIKNNNREELVHYLCDLHNKVNVRLKKPVFDCNKAFQFWGGECGCNEKKEAIPSTNSTSPLSAKEPEVKEAKVVSVLPINSTVVPEKTNATVVPEKTNATVVAVNITQSK